MGRVWELEARLLFLCLPYDPIRANSVGCCLAPAGYWTSFRPLVMTDQYLAPETGVLLQ